MALVKTARPLEIGDEILPWAETDEEYEEWERRIEAAKKELKELPQGSKRIIYLMKKEYKDQYSQNSKILYKRRVERFDYKTGAPDYKDHFLKFNWGMIKTSNYEEIAYLEMHPQWFIREENRELTLVEKQAKKIEELEAKLKLLSELKQVNEEIKEEEEKKIIKETDNEINNKAENEIKNEIENNKVEEKKVKKDGSSRRIKKRKNTLIRVLTPNSLEINMPAFQKRMKRVNNCTATSWKCAYCDFKKRMECFNRTVRSFQLEALQRFTTMPVWIFFISYNNFFFC